MLSQLLEDIARFPDHTDSYHSPDTKLLWMPPERRKCLGDHGTKKICLNPPSSAYLKFPWANWMRGVIHLSIELGNFTFFITASITAIQKLVQWCYSCLGNRRQKCYKMVACLWFLQVLFSMVLEKKKLSKTLHSNPSEKRKIQRKLLRTWHVISSNISQYLCFCVYFLSSFSVSFLSHKCPWKKVKFTLFQRIITVFITAGFFSDSEVFITHLCKTNFVLLHNLKN